MENVRSAVGESERFCVVGEKVFESMIKVLEKYEGYKLSDGIKKPVGRPCKECGDV